MKYILITLAVLLTGCSSLDNFVCYGAGTCGAGDSSQYSGSARTYVPTGGQQVMLPNGGYMIVRSQSTGQIMSVIQTSRSR